MGRFAPVFIGVLLVSEDGGENARTIAFPTAREARGRNQFPKLGARHHAAHNGQTTAPSSGHEPAGQTGLSRNFCRGQQLARRSSGGQPRGVEP